jgi:antitoxin VapB
MISMPSRSRRQQRAITIRSDHALARLTLLARDGRSQVQVIEEALDRMPVPKPLFDRAERRARIEAILASVPKRKYPTMAEIDAELYDDDGLPR